MAMTQAERLRHLSGTGWGKVLEKPEQELDIPYFLKPEYQQFKRFIKHNEEAKLGAIIGQERRKAREAKDAERHKKQNIIFVIALAVILLLVGAIE